MSTERQMKILYHLTRNGSLEVAQLSQMLDVSASTIRRDLTSMERNGFLVRRYGVAQLPSPVRYETPFEERAAREVNAKRKIAALAQTMVKPGDTVGLSGGTTATELARHLRAMEDVTIVTNALNIALELKTSAGKRVMVTGGILNLDSYDLIGDLSVQAFERVHLNVAFQGVTGIDYKFGYTVADEPDAVVARAIRAASDRLFVIADHTKIGKTTFARFCGLVEVDGLITDDGISPENRHRLESAGLAVFVAS